VAATILPQVHPSHLPRAHRCFARTTQSFTATVTAVPFIMHNCYYCTVAHVLLSRPLCLDITPQLFFFLFFLWPPPCPTVATGNRRGSSPAPQPPPRLPPHAAAAPEKGGLPWVHPHAPPPHSQGSGASPASSAGSGPLSQGRSGMAYVQAFLAAFEVRPWCTTYLLLASRGCPTPLFRALCT